MKKLFDWDNKMLIERIGKVLNRRGYEGPIQIQEASQVMDKGIIFVKYSYKHGFSFANISFDELCMNVNPKTEFDKWENILT